MADWVLQSMVHPSSRALCCEMMAACNAFTFTAFDALIGMDMPSDALAHLTGQGDIGRCRVEYDGSGHYQPERSGDPALILPVIDGGVLIDLVAFSPKNPNVWALRKGQGLILGLDYARGITADWESDAAELRVFANPMEWLYANQGGYPTGICVLDWSPESVAALRNLGPQFTLLADSPALAEFIDQEINKVRFVPQVAVMENGLELEAAE